MAETLDQWAERIERGVARLPRAVRGGLVRAATEAQRATRSAAPRGRTGRLRRSLMARVTGAQLDGMQVRIESDHPAARVQSEGGTIRARGAYLTVPIEPSVAELQPRTVAGLFRLRARDGREFLAVPDGQGGVRLMWRLMRQVRIRGTGYLGAGAERLQRAVAREALEAMDAELGVSRGR